MPLWVELLAKFLTSKDIEEDVIRRLSSELNEVTRHLERFIKLGSEIRDLKRPFEDLTKDIQNLSQGIQNLNKPIVDVTLAFHGLATVSLRASETLVTFYRNLVSAEDALSATAQTLTAISAGISLATEGFQQITKVATIVEDVVSRVNQTLQNALSSIADIISSYHTVFQSIAGMLAGFATSIVGIFTGEILSSVVSSMLKFASTFMEVVFLFPTLYAPIIALVGNLTLLTIEFQKAAIAVQQFILPLRFLAPIVEAYLKIVSELIGALGRLTMEIRNLIFQSLAPLQGQVLMLSAAFSMTRETIEQVAESIGRFGLTLQSVMEYVRTSISQGVMPLQSMVQALGELALQFSYISGLTPEEVFRRLSQAVLEGNVALLNQLNILMTQADLLNILAARYGLLVSSIQEIPPFIRQQIMLDIVGRERERIEREGPRSLLEIVGLLRGIYQQFLTFIGRAMSFVTFPQQIIDRLLESLRRLWSTEVAERLGRSIATFISYVFEGLRPIVETLREFFMSPALTNLTAVISGAISGLMSGINQILQRILKFLTSLDPNELFARAAAAAEAFALTLADAFPAIVQFISVIGQAAMTVISNFDKIFNALSAAIKVAINAMNLLGVITIGLVQAFTNLAKNISLILALMATVGAVASALLQLWPAFFFFSGAAALFFWQYFKDQQAGGPKIAGFDLGDLSKKLQDSIKEAEKAFGGLSGAFAGQDFGGKIQDALGKLGSAAENFSKHYEEAYNRFRQTKFTERMEETSRAIEASFKDLIQVIQPVTEQFRNWRDLLLESIGVFSVVLGEPGLRRVGDVFLHFPRTAEMGMAALEMAYEYMRASSARLATTIFAMATGARGAASSFFQEMNNFIKSIRDLNNTVIRTTTILGQSVRDFAGILLGQIRAGVIMGGSLAGVIPAFTQAIPAVLTYTGLRLGEILQFMARYQEIARISGLIGTPEYLSTMNQLLERFIETARQGAEPLRIFGEYLSAWGSSLLSIAQILSSVSFGLRDFNTMVAATTYTVAGLFDQLTALFYRAIAAIMSGNLEEAARLLGQLGEQARKVFYEELPRAIASRVEERRAPLDMWMSGFQQLREVLREIGAEGMAFPLALRNAIPVLTDLIRMLAYLRDQAFAQGLIPVAMEFNNQLMRAQRQILEILGISGMFLPAYTPAEIVREREMWGMLPAGFVARMARGGIPALAPPVRVVPFGQLFRLLGYIAPGMLGLFGPFVTAEGLFTLLNLTGLFSGLWGGYGFLGRVSPWMIRENFLNLMRPFLIAPLLLMLSPSRVPLLGMFLSAFQYGATRTIRPETMFTPEAWGRTVEVGRIIASQIVADMISVTEDPQRRKDLEEIRRGILGAPVRYGPPIPTLTSPQTPGRDNAYALSGLQYYPPIRYYHPSGPFYYEAVPLFGWPGYYGMTPILKMPDWRVSQSWEDFLKFAIETATDPAEKARYEAELRYRKAINEGNIEEAQRALQEWMELSKPPSQPPTPVPPPPSPLPPPPLPSPPPPPQTTAYLRLPPASITTPVGFEPSGPVEIPVRLALNADIVGQDGTVLDTITRELSTVVVLQPKVVRTLG